MLSEGAAINSLKLLFPNGCKISPQKKNPIHQSCYITVDDSSLDQCMLTFIKYSEKMSDQFVENVDSNHRQYSNCNFRDFKELYVEKAIGFISQHHDNKSTEKLLNYIYACLQASSMSVPIEVIGL